METRESITQLERLGPRGLSMFSDVRPCRTVLAVLSNAPDPTHHYYYFFIALIIST